MLRNFEESPQLPAGYTGMITLAMFPPAWYWVMNPLVKAHKNNVAKVKAARAEDPKAAYVKGSELKEAERSANVKMMTYLGTVFAVAVYQLRKK